MDRHEGVNATHSELEELDSLKMVLVEQWGYLKLMFSSKDPEVLYGSDNVVSTLGVAVLRI